MHISGAVNLSSVAGGTELRCTAEAHPTPSYMWTNHLDNGSTVEGPSFIVEARTYYQLTCTATNIITFANGTTQTCSSHAYFQVDGM